MRTFNSSNRVLVVEEDVGISELISSILTDEGFTIDRVTTGEEAIKMARQDLYSITIFDYHLPGMSGMEYFEKLKRGQPGILAVVMASNRDFNAALKAIQMGAVGFLLKPFTNFELKKQVEQIRILSANRRSRELIFRHIVNEKHEMTFETGDLMTGDNFFLVSMHLAELFTSSGELPFDRKLRYGLAIHESLRNAIEHGNLELSSQLKKANGGSDFGAEYDRVLVARLKDPKYSRKKVTISFERNNDTVLIRIRDEGNGFDHVSAKRHEQDIKDGIEECCGRGLVLLEAYMDKVDYNDKGNEIRLYRFLQ